MFGFPTHPPPTAGSVSYSPGDPSSWDPPPADVSDALDQMASRVSTLEASSPVSTETAGATLAAGTSVYRSSSDRMLAEDGSYAALRDAFAGFTTSASTNGNPVTVASNGARATGLSSLTVGSGYYVSAGTLIAESGLAAWITGASSGTWYRFVGTADSTTSIRQAWAEPQQVP